MLLVVLAIEPRRVFTVVKLTSYTLATQRVVPRAWIEIQPPSSHSPLLHTLLWNLYFNEIHESHSHAHCSLRSTALGHSSRPWLHISILCGYFKKCQAQDPSITIKLEPLMIFTNLYTDKIENCWPSMIVLRINELR